MRLGVVVGPQCQSAPWTTLGGGGVARHVNGRGTKGRALQVWYSCDEHDDSTIRYVSMEGHTLNTDVDYTQSIHPPTVRVPVSRNSL